MPPDPFTDDDDEQYASSEDSDFAPDEAPEQGSEQSDSDDGEAKPTAKRRRPAGDVDGQDGQDDGYDNSGDEAIIEKGRKRRKKAKNKGQACDDEDGGEGGLIKTRRQRAEEKEERKFAASKGPVTVDVDALWQQMISGKSTHPTSDGTIPGETTETESRNGDGDELGRAKQEIQAAAAGDDAAGDDAADTIRIKRTYNFAGRVHTEEKVVARDSAEAKLYLASQGRDVPADSSPTKQTLKKAFHSAFEPLVDAAPGRTDLNLRVAARMKAAKDAQAKKLNTVEKSRMDWAGYVDREGIQDELQLASKSKGSYNAREDFLARSEAVREDEARRARMAARFGLNALYIPHSNREKSRTLPTSQPHKHISPRPARSEMAVLGKRKAPEPAVSQEDANEIFRRHFESRFEPLEASKENKTEDETKEVDDEDEEWGGLSDDEISDDDEGKRLERLLGEDAIADETQVQTVEVVDHSSSQAPKPTSMSKRELKAFMSSRPPDQTANPKDDTTATATAIPSTTLPEDAPSLLAQDLELRRLLAESHLLSRNSSTSLSASAAAEPKSFAAGRTRQKATDLRIQALGSGISIHTQEKMPMNMRKGMVAAAGAREAKRRREARENGVILEKETGKKRRRGGGRDAAVNRPGVGRLRGAELRISERDVRSIEGGRDAFGRRGKR
ncbi:Swr1-complex protein 5 [Tolypocladium capitatum]|uniref:SWR1-complex protein 5 n=1 Tax=Tolypocladium capitatum TaxID=45235 RepID=A0A2K3QA67_9HYPO|nr:Swr1-complex protein 5 [Tolypocladium capitatum]